MQHEWSIDPRRGAVLSVRLDALGKTLLITTRGGWIARCDLERKQGYVMPCDGIVRLAAWGPDETTIGLASDGVVRVWPAPPQSLPVPTIAEPMTVLAPGGDDAAVLAGLKGGRLLQVHVRQQIAATYVPEGSLKVSPDARVLAIRHKPLAWIVSDPQRHETWLYRDGGDRTRRQFTAGPVSSAAFVTDAEAVLLGGRNVVYRWSPAEDRLASHDCPDLGAIGMLKLSPDQKTLLAAGQSGRLVFLDATTGRSVRDDLENDAWVSTAAFSCDGKQVAAAFEDGMIRIWKLDQPDAAPLSIRSRQTGRIVVAFSRDGQTLVSADEAYKVRLWDVATGLLRGQTLVYSTAAVHDLYVGPDGRSFLTAGEHSLTGYGAIHRWPLPQGWPDAPELVRLRVEVQTGSLGLTRRSPCGVCPWPSGSSGGRG